MPIPVIVAIVVAVIGTLTALNWKAIVIALQGKHVAVLGARNVGKTHLVTFITTGSLPEEYNQTVAPKKAPARRFQLKELDIKVKESLDLSGDKAAYAEWKKLHDRADFVFYLLRADRLFARDGCVERRVLEDLQHIGQWLEAREPRPRFFIVGTFCDLDPEFHDLPGDKVGDYVDKFRSLPVVSELILRGGGAGQARVVLGSMKTLKDTETLVYQIFMQVTK